MTHVYNSWRYEDCSDKRLSCVRVSNTPAIAEANVSSGRRGWHKRIDRQVASVSRDAELHDGQVIDDGQSVDKVFTAAKRGVLKKHVATKQCSLKGPPAQEDSRNEALDSDVPFCPFVQPLCFGPSGKSQLQLCDALRAPNHSEPSKIDRPTTLRVQNCGERGLAGSKLAVQQLTCKIT